MIEKNWIKKYLCFLVLFNVLSIAYSQTQQAAINRYASFPAEVSDSINLAHNLGFTTLSDTSS